MDKKREQVSAWLSEAEDYFILNDSDDTDADPDFFIQNDVESGCDNDDDLTTSNTRRRISITRQSRLRSPPLVDYSIIMSKPAYFLGKDSN